MTKLRIGVLFGGRSKEREVSFAGGRTVYDNLDRNLYIPVPIFITDKNEFFKLKWEFIYKGSIKDFYPSQVEEMGEKIPMESLKDIIDVAFLVLHGLDGEDGHVQGLLEWLNIPYTGSKVLGSALGISKFIQKELMKNYGYKTNKFKFLFRDKWLKNRCTYLDEINNEFNFPFVVKSANQGSSIGVSIAHNAEDLEKAIDTGFGILKIKKNFWDTLVPKDKYEFLKKNITEKIEFEFPVTVDGNNFGDAYSLMHYLDGNTDEEFFIHANIHDDEVLIEDFIRGREFSCIVLQKKNEEPQALFPTEILLKDSEFFDYRSKYMLGASMKVTPMQIEENEMKNIRDTSVKLFKDLHFKVFARMDGFISEDNEVIINDANSISGMEPISLLFQQAVYSNLSPKQLLTFIITNSL